MHVGPAFSFVAIVFIAVVRFVGNDTVALQPCLKDANKKTS